MNALIILAAIAGGLFLAMTGAWAARLLSGQSGWIDGIWSLAVGAGGVAAALVPLHAGDVPQWRQWLAAALVAMWAVRLGGHILVRTAAATADDPRYARLAQDWGRAFPRRLFGFLQVQAAAALVLAAAVMAAARNPAPTFAPGDGLALAIFAAALLGETVADRQLTRFRADPANHGRVCDVGLWSWSRHPNYFFEWLVWLAYPAMAIDLSGTWPWGWGALAAPVLMYVLLVHVSGIPLLEAHMMRSRGAAFAAYRDRVSAFFPWPPLN